MRQAQVTGEVVEGKELGTAVLPHTKHILLESLQIVFAPVQSQEKRELGLPPTQAAHVPAGEIIDPDGQLQFMVILFHGILD